LRQNGSDRDTSALPPAPAQPPRPRSVSRPQPVWQRKRQRINRLYADPEGGGIRPAESEQRLAICQINGLLKVRGCNRQDVWMQKGRTALRPLLNHEIHRSGCLTRNQTEPDPNGIHGHLTHAARQKPGELHRPGDSRIRNGVPLPCPPNALGPAPKIESDPRLSHTERLQFDRKTTWTSPLRSAGNLSTSARTVIQMLPCTPLLSASAEREPSRERPLTCHIRGAPTISACPVTRLLELQPWRAHWG